MKPSAHGEISSACLSRHPAVAHLFLVRPMTKRTVLYIVIALNVLYITALAICAFVIGHLHPPDFPAMRSKIEASSSLEDLRPRALHAISAIESADRAIGDLHEVAACQIGFGITLAVVNLLVLCFVMPRTLRV